MGFVSYRFNVTRLLLVVVLVVPGVLLCQSRKLPRTGSGSAPAHVAAEPTDQQLAGLLAAQQAALRGEDAAAIESAARPLAAYALRQLAQLRLVEGKANEATELERKSLGLQDLAETRLEVASVLLRTGRPKEASDETLMVLGAEPLNAAAWAIRGSALRATGDDKTAVYAFNRSLKLQPSISVAFALASSLLAIHDEAKARVIFGQIFAASDNAAIQHVAAGDAYLEARYLQEAVEEFKKAIALDPRVAHAEFFLGFTYLQMNEWGPNSQSFEHLRAAVRLAPKDYLSNFYLGAIESTDGTDLAASNRHLRVAAEADPRSPEVWLYLGLNAVHEKDMDHAKEYLRKAVALTGSDEARNNYQIRRVYAVLGRILVSEGNHAEGDALLAKYRSSEQNAIGNSSAVIARAAGQDDAHASLSGMAAAKMDFPGMSSLAAAGAGATGQTGQTMVAHSATETAQLAAMTDQLSKLLAGAMNDLGTAEARQGKYAPALTHFHEAALWQPPSAGLERNIGVAAFRLGNFSESARALTRFFELQPAGDATEDERARTMLAMSQFSIGDYQAAQQAFGRVPLATMRDPRAAYSWAFALAHAGQQQRANEVAGDLLKQPLEPEVRSLVCHIYMDTESYEQSLACYESALVADAQLKMAHYQKAESLIRLDRPAEAVAELRRELSNGGGSTDVQYALAFALLQNSQRAEATALLRSITEAHPTHAQAQYQLGKILLEDGETARAVEHLEAAEASDAGLDYIHYQLQAAYRKAGRLADAERELQLYRTIKERGRKVQTN